MWILCPSRSQCSLGNKPDAALHHGPWRQLLLSALKQTNLPASLSFVTSGGFSFNEMLRLLLTFECGSSSCRCTMWFYFKVTYLQTGRTFFYVQVFIEPATIWLTDGTSTSEPDWWSKRIIRENLETLELNTHVVVVGLLLFLCYSLDQLVID